MLAGSNFSVVGSPMDGVLLHVEGDSQRRGGVVGEVLIGGPQVIIVLQCVAVCCSALQCIVAH